MKRVVFTGDTCRNKLKEGIDFAANAIAPTLGPRGASAIIHTNSFPYPAVIDDGVTIARALYHEDGAVNTGVALIKEVASQADDSGGDGTSTATLFTQRIISEGIRQIAAGTSKRAIKNGIERATRIVTESIKSRAHQVKDIHDLTNIATVSSNDKALGELVAKAIDKVGKEGRVQVEESNYTETVLDTISGMTINKGMVDRGLANTKQGTFEKKKCKIVLMDKELGLLEATKLLEVALVKSVPILIFAETFSPVVIGGMKYNAAQLKLATCAVRNPAHGDLKREQMSDICELTGATVLGDANGITLDALNTKEMESIDKYMQYFGEADVVVSNKETILMVEKMSDRANKRIEELRTQLQEPTLTPYDRDNLQTRLANLTGGISIIKVGGYTDTEVTAKKAKIEDAKNATKSALVSGYVAGGGSAYLRAALDLSEVLSDKEALDAIPEEEIIGMHIVLQALPVVTEQLAENSGLNGKTIVDKIYEKIGTIYGYGLNAVTGKLCDLYDEGIIDSVQVIINSLEKASSVSATVLMSETLITEQTEECDKVNCGTRR